MRTAWEGVGRELKGQKGQKGRRRTWSPQGKRARKAEKEGLGLWGLVGWRVALAGLVGCWGVGGALDADGVGGMIVDGCCCCGRLVGMMGGCCGVGGALDSDGVGGMMVDGCCGCGGLVGMLVGCWCGG